VQYLHGKRLRLGVSPEDTSPTLGDLPCCARTELYSTESPAPQPQSAWPGRSPASFPHALLAVSPVLISSCSAAQSFCAHSLLANAAAALPSGVATGLEQSLPFLIKAHRASQGEQEFKHSHHSIQKAHSWGDT